MAVTILDDNGREFDLLFCILVGILHGPGVVGLCVLWALVGRRMRGGVLRSKTLDLYLAGPSELVIQLGERKGFVVQLGNVVLR